MAPMIRRPIGLVRLASHVNRDREPIQPKRKNQKRKRKPSVDIPRFLSLPPKKMDVVTCLGPSDEALLSTLVTSVRQHLQPRRIYVIAPAGIIERQRTAAVAVAASIHWVDEATFPFTKKDIARIFRKDETYKRSGWYLQQLLKIYAPLQIPELSRYVIIDADVRFHQPATFFEGNRILFNVGTEHHLPYFEHLHRLLGLPKLRPESGICHLMPMERDIVEALVHEVEQRHGEPFWRVFLECVSPSEYDTSGASEYEILFTFAWARFPDRIAVRPLRWQNTSLAEHHTEYVYEAWHCYLRP